MELRRLLVPFVVSTTNPMVRLMSHVLYIYCKCPNGNNTLKEAELARYSRNAWRLVLQHSRGWIAMWMGHYAKVDSSSFSRFPSSIVANTDFAGPALSGYY